ncbi:hypothetical protein [Sinorhizobium meliloti]|nr:hypothetical protein [Sinorhizobium meliloti]
MSEIFEHFLSLLRVPTEHQGFVIGLAAIALAGYAIYAILSVVKGR